MNQDNDYDVSIWPADKPFFKASDGNEIYLDDIVSFEPSNAGGGCVTSPKTAIGKVSWSGKFMYAEVDVNGKKEGWLLHPTANVKLEKAGVNHPKTKVQTDGAIHHYFGLSYANYLTLPRTVLQSMPHEWQSKFVELLNQIPELLGTEWEPTGGYHVQAKDEHGKFVKDDLADYERGRRRLPLKKNEVSK